MSSKTEKPTPKRLRDARKKGQVIKSEDVVTFAQLLALLLFVVAQARPLFDAIAALVVTAVESIRLPFPLAVANCLNVAAGLVLPPMLRFGGLLAGVTVLAFIAQIGFLVSFESMKPSFKAFNVVKNVKQIFSRKSLFDLIKSCLKISILFYLVGYVLWRHAGALQMMFSSSLDQGLGVLYELAYFILVCAVIASMVFAAADYAFRRYDEMKKLKMSKDEVKREYKDTEGNPEVKQTRKWLHQELQSGSLASRVADSAVVVRNPTHVAVCIHYRPDEMPLPEVAEKGRDTRAADIIRLAEQANVPIVEDVPLAWRLMIEAEVGDCIPASLFEPVAAVLREVMSIGYDQDDSEDGADTSGFDNFDGLDDLDDDEELADPGDGGDAQDADDLPDPHSAFVDPDRV